jgi:hypothetical protein
MFERSNCSVYSKYRRNLQAITKYSSITKLVLRWQPPQIHLYLYVYLMFLLLLSAADSLILSFRYSLFFAPEMSTTSRFALF